MAVLGTTYLNIADKLKRTDPDGSGKKIATIIELLAATNELMEDALVLEGNLQTGHRTTMRSGLPSVTWRKLYGYTQPSKSTTVQVDEACGRMEGYSVVDKQLAELNGDEAALRLSEDTAFFESMNQEMASTVFYGNTDTAPEEFLGLTPRFSDTTAENGGQIIDGGGTGNDNTSIWFIKWGENYCHLIYPKGTQAGLKHKDLGEQTETDSNGGKRQVLTTHYTWDVGMALRDWRHIVRIANIDVSALATAGESGYTGANLINLLIKALHKLENLKGGKIAIYCNRDVMTAIDLLAANKENVYLTQKEFGGQMVTMFRGFPFRLCEAILSTEAAVTF